MTELLVCPKSMLPTCALGRHKLDQWLTQQLKVAVAWDAKTTPCPHAKP